MQFKRSARIVYRRAASEALTEETPSLRTVLASRSPHLVVRERACWAGMSDERGEWILPREPERGRRTIVVNGQREHGER